MNKNYLKVCSLGLSLMSMSSFAGILAESTRVIYPEGKREVSLMLNNTNSYPVLTQIWVDDGTGNPDTAKAPFLALSPIFKLNTQETKGIRIVHTGQNLNANQESVFWLNLYEVPAVEAKKLDDNYVNLSMNTQLKVFYRPKGLTGMDIKELNQRLSFQLIEKNQQRYLRVENSSPYYISMAQLELNTANEKSNIDPTGLMVAPQHYKEYPISTETGTKIQLEYVLIDDHGHHHAFNSVIQG